MSDPLALALGLLIPLLGTTAGAALVFFFRSTLSPKLNQLLLGFASGVMIAASIWSLLLPAIEMSERQTTLSWLPASIGFLAGMGFLLFMDHFIPHIHAVSGVEEGPHNRIKKTTKLFFAVTLHNIPEGMGVGVVFAALLYGNHTVSWPAAWVLALGIAIQNLPEGAIISMPLKNQGLSRTKAFLYGFFSGVVEPIAAVVTLLLTGLVLPILPYLLSFAAGAMLYVVVEELIPDSQTGSHSNLGTIGVAIGFVLMMILDLALG